jgi:hypothetical protein
MRNKLSLVATVLLTGMSLFLCGCKKASTFARVIQQKLACDVAKYSVDIDNGVPASNVTVFQKTYDAEGKTVTEIECVFFEPFSSSSETSGGSSFYGLQHDLLVAKSDSSLLLRDKNNLADTAMLVLFNKEGRPTSSITSLAGNITDNFHSGDTESFTYKGGRIFSVQELGFPIDTVHYDSLGNLLSFAGNTYIYDYDRQATESFYITDYQARDHGYYLLQYLGYFPEVTNTTNIRSNLSNSDLTYKANLAGEQYDPAGRVIGFNTYVIQGTTFGGTSWSTAIGYHCQ